MSGLIDVDGGAQGARGAVGVGQRYVVVGSGAVATALFGALSRAHVPVVQWSRRSTEPLPLGTVVLLAVSDGAHPEVAAQVLARHRMQPPPVLLSCGAGVPLESLRHGGDPSGGVGLLHPLRAFTGSPGESQLDGTLFALAGDEPAREAALGIVELVGGRPLALGAAPDAQLRYHAAAVLISNHVFALLSAGVALFEQAGLDRSAATEAAGPLLQSVVDNLARQGLPAALTGPVARGDVETVHRHLALLSGAPAVERLYRETGRWLLALSEARGRASDDQLAAIAELLVDSSERVPTDAHGPP